MSRDGGSKTPLSEDVRRLRAPWRRNNQSGAGIKEIDARRTAIDVGRSEPVDLKDVIRDGSTSALNSAARSRRKADRNDKAVIWTGM